MSLLGIGLLVGLGRRLVQGPLADSGLLPAGYYRHLGLKAMETDDFPRALTCLKWAQDPLLVQILVLRLRLLSLRHVQQRQAVQSLLEDAPPAPQTQKCRDLLAQEERALELLRHYEGQALNLLT